MNFLPYCPKAEKVLDIMLEEKRRFRIKQPHARVFFDEKAGLV
jgi:hypothetical protein